MIQFGRVRLLPNRKFELMDYLENCWLRGSVALPKKLNENF